MHDSVVLRYLIKIHEALDASVARKVGGSTRSVVSSLYSGIADKRRTSLRLYVLRAQTDFTKTCIREFS